MKATPTRLPEGQGALVVPDSQTGKELLLTETGYRTLRTVLQNEVEATRIAAGSLLAGALVCGIGAAAALSPMLALGLVPVALATGALWGRASFARKLLRLSQGQIPRRAVLGGGKQELFTAGLLAALLLLPPVHPSLGLMAFMITTAAAIFTYGSRSGRLAREVEAAFEDPAVAEAAGLLENPDDLLVLGQGRGEGGVCPVCGDGLGGPGSSVHCARCRSGHHPECWTYAGGRCSVYGCGGDEVYVDDLADPSLG